MKNSHSPETVPAAPAARSASAADIALQLANQNVNTLIHELEKAFAKIAVLESQLSPKPRADGP